MNNIDYAILERSILGIFLEYNNKITEFELIKNLQKINIIEEDTNLKNNLELFKVHFLLFHMLYKLRLKWIKEEKWILDITLVSLTLFPYSSGKKGLTIYDPLAEYYLDIRNYDTEEEEINKIIDNFWMQYLASEQKNRALLILGLEEPIDFIIIKKKYRELARIYHPDSGKEESEIKIKELNYAMAVLNKYYN